MTYDHDRTDELRRRLAEQALYAPTGDGLAERIIAQAESGPQPRPIGGRNATWLRLVAVAAAVIAIAGVAVAVAHKDSGPDRDEAVRTAPVPPSSASATPGPATSSTATPSRSSASPDDASQPRQITVPTLTGVRVVDITFTGGGDGWALGTADCLKGSGTCSALLHTDNDGRSWQGRPNTPFTVTGDQSCRKDNCVSHIRFATDATGYAYGRSAMFLTTDGAKSWKRLGGGADALETLDGNVIRVRSDAGSCPPGCDYTVQVADVGSTSWRDVDLPGPATGGDGVTLARSGAQAYLLGYGNPAGGAGRATSTLWTSDNDGRDWVNRREPCAQQGGEIDARALTTTADGAVVVVCQQRSGGRAQSVAISTDKGAGFTTGPAVLGAAEVTALGAATSRTVIVSSDSTYRSTDAGRRFVRSPDIGSASYLGFSSDRDAHAISTDGRTIFTTSDAGRSWLAVRFR